MGKILTDKQKVFVQHFSQTGNATQAAKDAGYSAKTAEQQGYELKNKLSLEIENETRKLLTTGFFHNGPASIRYPRGSGPNVDVKNDLSPVEIGKGRLIKERSRDLIVINFGALLDQAKEVANTLGLTLIDMRFVKPLDEDILRKYLTEAQAFVSIEDGSVAGGAGSAVQEFCSDNDINIKSKLFGIPDVFIEHQSREEMIEESGLTASKIIKEIEELRLVK